MEQTNREYTYLIELQDHLDLGWSSYFDNMSLSLSSQGTTILSGRLRDQAALHALLRKVQNLGLTLIGLQRNVVSSEEE
jgi:hypothetical protein